VATSCENESPVKISNADSSRNHGKDDGDDDLLNAVISSSDSPESKSHEDMEVPIDDDDDADDEDDDLENSHEPHVQYEIEIEEFHEADSNKDLSLDLDEFIDYSKTYEHDEDGKTENSELDEKRHKASFADYDKNGDNKIGLHEVETHIPFPFPYAPFSMIEADRVRSLLTVLVGTNRMKECTLVCRMGESKWG
jgi:hypothetical protein